MKRSLPFRRAAVVAALVWLLVFMMATLVTYILPESFAGTVRIKVERDPNEITSVVANRGNLGYDPYFIQTEFEAIQSGTVLTKVIDLLGLNNRWGDRFGGGMRLKTTDTLELLKRRLMLRPARNTSLIELTVYSEDRTEAAQIANAIAESYRDFRREQRANVASNGIKSLEAGSRELQERIQKAQKELDALRGALNISDADANASASLPLMDGETLRKLEALRIEGEARLTSLQASVARLKTLSRDELRTVVPRFRPDPHLNELLNQLTLAEQSLAGLEKDFAPEHPNVRRVQQQIASLRKEVDENIEGLMTAIGVEVTMAEAQVNALKKSVPEARKQDQEKAERSRPFFDKKRELEELQSFGRVLNMKLEAERIDLALPKSSIIEIVDRAVPGAKPVRPNKPLNLVLGAVLGLLLGLLTGALTLLPAAFPRKPKTSVP